MSPSTDTMRQVGAPSYSSPPFIGMDSNPWNQMFPIQPSFSLNQLPISQPT